jgi:hypothetical protein
MKMMPCHKSKGDLHEEYCGEVVSREFKGCGHAVSAPCSTFEGDKCTMKRKLLLPCGHNEMVPCHQLKRLEADIPLR